MNMWTLICMAYFDDGLVVLGPKCRTADCADPAVERVFWPSGMFLACERCTSGWRRIADAMGVALHVERLYYQRGGMTDAELRFAAMELT